MSSESTEQLPDDQEELRARIEETRSDLGDTVEALSAKADVKAKLGEMGEKAKQDPRPLAVGGGIVALLLLVFLRKRRKR